MTATLRRRYRITLDEIGRVLTANWEHSILQPAYIPYLTTIAMTLVFVRERTSEDRAREIIRLVHVRINLVYFLPVHSVMKNRC